MPEHFTRNTVEASFWCSKCAKMTMHRVDGVKRGPCLVCMERLATSPAPKKPKAVEQGALFSDPLMRDTRGD
jgi:hypothetical protein